MLSRNQTQAFRVALVVAFLTISYLVTTPVPPDIGVSDKLEHAVTFAALAFLVDFSFPRRGFDWRKIAPLVGYGILIEVVQYFIPHRSSEVLDVVADSSGLIVYALAVPVLRTLPLLRRRWATDA